MRRTRRSKYIWMPLIGTQGTSEDFDSSGFVLPVIQWPALAGHTSDVFITEVIPDAPKEAVATADDNLSDFTQNEYFLRRIVGKIHYRVALGNSGLTPNNGILAAGFFIARSEGGGNTRPVGAATAAEARLNYGPLNTSTAREPWIWRRTWCLDLSPATAAKPTVIQDIRQFGSVLDGGHIDAKTARRVKSDERLWFALQGACIDDVDATSTLVSGEGWLDVRILGQMRKPKSRGVF